MKNPTTLSPSLIKRETQFDQVVIGKLIVYTFILVKSFHMKRTVIVITLATLYLLLFRSSPLMGIPDELIIAMFILSPIVVIYMAYVILKYGKPSGHTFEERFYDDVDYKRKD